MTFNTDLRYQQYLEDKKEHPGPETFKTDEGYEAELLRSPFLGYWVGHIKTGPDFPAGFYDLQFGRQIICSEIGGRTTFSIDCAHTTDYIPEEAKFAQIPGSALLYIPEVKEYRDYNYIKTEVIRLSKEIKSKFDIKE